MAMIGHNNEVVLSNVIHYDDLNDINNIVRGNIIMRIMNTFLLLLLLLIIITIIGLKMMM